MREYDWAISVLHEAREALAYPISTRADSRPQHSSSSTHDYFHPTHLNQNLDPFLLCSNNRFQHAAYAISHQCTMTLYTAHRKQHLVLVATLAAAAVVVAARFQRQPERQRKRRRRVYERLAEWSRKRHFAVVLDSEGREIRARVGWYEPQEPEELKGVGDYKVHGNYIQSSDLRDVGYCTV
jgi:hypothetical protein